MTPVANVATFRSNTNTDSLIFLEDYTAISDGGDGFFQWISTTSVARTSGATSGSGAEACQSFPDIAPLIRATADLFPRLAKSKSAAAGVTGPVLRQHRAADVEMKR
jgi:hypothetical protein